MPTEKILTHEIERTLNPVLIREIGHQNKYNYLKLHRHNYFEVMFFNKGGGENQIDLRSYEVQNCSCYIIYPNQTHLLKRKPSSSGLLIQFKLATVVSQSLARLLQERAWSGTGNVIFENNDRALNRVLMLVNAMQELTKNKTTYWKQSQQRLLEALLFELCAFGEIDGHRSLDKEMFQFQQLVDCHYKTAHSVQFYMDKMGISAKRLGAFSKAHSGCSPLQVIHRRLLLETRRLIVLGDMAHKEIAYDLGFDSPASFSAFVKKKTGYSPSALRALSAEIQNK